MRSYIENLLVDVTGIGGAISAPLGDLSEIAAGDSTGLPLGFSTATAGIFSGTVTLLLDSDGAGTDGAPVTEIAAPTLEISGAIDNYATAAITQTGGRGTLTQSGTADTIDLGVVEQGSGPIVADFSVVNTAVGLADLLSGSFSTAGATGFANSGLADFAGLAAGEADLAPAATLSTATGGFFSETITLDATGSNASGYSGALPEQTITIKGTVESLSLTAPGTLAAIIGEAAALAGFAISDSAAAGNTVYTVTLTDSAGSLAAPVVAGGTVTGGGTALTLSGSLLQVNAELAATTFTGSSADQIGIRVTSSIGGTAGATTTVNVAPASVPTSDVVFAQGDGLPAVPASQLTGKINLAPATLADTVFARIESTQDWNSLKNLSFAPSAADIANEGTNFLFANFVETDVDLRAAGAASLTVDVFGAKRGTLLLGDGNNTVTWAAESNGAIASGPGTYWSNTVTIAVGNGNNDITVEGVGSATLDATLLAAHADPANDSFYWNPDYNGFYTRADVTLGSGANVVTLTGSGNSVTAPSITGTDYIDLASGGNSSVTGGNGNFVILAGGKNNHVTLGIGNNMVFITGPGTNPSLPSGAAVPVDQGAAVVTTGAGNDTINLGGSGNTVNAGGGTNIIYGGTGSDTFVLPAAGEGFDTITNFKEINLDVLDLRAALAATSWNGSASTLSAYLSVTSGGGNTTIAISDAPGGSAIAVAGLSGSGNLGLSDLLSHHALLT